MKKLCSKIYTYCLAVFYKTIDFDNNVIVDCRCEIEKKTNIQIGNDSKLYKNITIYKDKEGIFEMGDSSHIAPYGYFLIEKQTLRIGNNVAIGPYCSIFCSTNTGSKNKNILFKDTYKKGDVVLGNNILIGTHCIILPETIIEDDVVIAANSTIKGRLESGFLYGGNPVKKIRSVYNG